MNTKTLICELTGMGRVLMLLCMMGQRLLQKRRLMAVRITRRNKVLVDAGV